MAMMEINLYSEVLDLEIPVSVILPQNPDHPLKTIWLYHGSTGDHTLWLRYTSLERYVRERGLAAVIPTGHKSLFTNMAHGQNYGTFLGEELVMRLRQIFPCLSAAREDNFVCGLSNGAYGAFRIGLRYPETFSAIALSLAEIRQTNISPMMEPIADAAMCLSLGKAVLPRVNMALSIWRESWQSRVVPIPGFIMQQVL